jgi:hypothetical protein
MKLRPVAEAVQVLDRLLTHHLAAARPDSAGVYGLLEERLQLGTRPNAYVGYQRDGLGQLCHQCRREPP